MASTASGAQWRTTGRRAPPLLLLPLLAPEDELPEPEEDDELPEPEELPLEDEEVEPLPEEDELDELCAA